MNLEQFQSIPVWTKPKSVVCPLWSLLKQFEKRFSHFFYISFMRETSKIEKKICLLNQQYLSYETENSFKSIPVWTKPKSVVRPLWSLLKQFEQILQRIHQLIYSSDHLQYFTLKNIEGGPWQNSCVHYLHARERKCQKILILFCMNSVLSSISTNY